MVRILVGISVAIKMTVKTYLNEQAKRAKFPYLGIARKHVWECYHSCDQALGSIFNTILCTLVFWCKISIDFVIGKNCFNRLKMVVFSNIYRTICLERIIFFYLTNQKLVKIAQFWHVLLFFHSYGNKMATDQIILMYSERIKALCTILYCFTKSMNRSTPWFFCKIVFQTVMYSKNRGFLQSWFMNHVLHTLLLPF